MRVMVIVKASKSSEAGELPTQELLAAMGKFNEELVAAGIMMSGDGLKASSYGVRIRFSGTDRTISTGPFEHTNELIAGYWVWKVSSMDEAIEWVKRCPNPMTEDSDIEIRPFFEAEDFGAAFTDELREQEASLRAQSLGLGTIEFRQGSTLRVAGMSERYSLRTRSEIPEHWSRFAPYIGNIPGQIGGDAYGICLNAMPDHTFDYLTGVAVSSDSALCDGFSSITLEPRRYVVFHHQGHVSQLPSTLENIWTRWMPQCGLSVAIGVPWFERYSTEFDPQSGMNGMEVWLPLKS